MNIGDMVKKSDGYGAEVIPQWIGLVVDMTIVNIPTSGSSRLYLDVLLPSGEIESWLASMWEFI